MTTSTLLRFSLIFLTGGAMAACQPATPAAEAPAETTVAEASAATEATPEQTEPASMEHADHAGSGHAAAMDEASGDMAGMEHGAMAHTDHGGMDMHEVGEYDPADWSNQPGASVGDVTRCPVSGEEFRVTEDSTFFEHNGEKVYFCCPGCIRQFQRNPDALLAAAFPVEGSGGAE
jgi:YHS domain-containing protein